MKKTEFVEAVAEKAGISKAEAGRAVEAVLDVITEALKAQEQVTLTGFGSFLVRDRAARTGHNPKTHEKIHIKASKVPSFKAGKALKDALN